MREAGCAMAVSAMPRSAPVNSLALMVRPVVIGLLPELTRRIVAAPNPWPDGPLREHPDRRGLTPRGHWGEPTAGSRHAVHPSRHLCRRLHRSREEAPRCGLHAPTPQPAVAHLDL